MIIERYERLRITVIVNGKESTLICISYISRCSVIFVNSIDDLVQTVKSFKEL